MREELHIFRDPENKKPLVLEIIDKKGTHIISGKLYNEFNQYPIIGGIPRFVDKKFYTNHMSFSKEQQTASSFGSKWRDKRSLKLGHTISDVNNLKEQFLAVLGCETFTQLKNILKKSKRVLNAGCGVAWSEYLFNPDLKTERHCIDISLSVETAYNKTGEIPNVIVAQASILELPYEDKIFDIVYSIGVIHHTYDPKRAFISLAQKVKSGGLLGVYIYNKKPFLREIADSEIRNITTKMSYKECMRFSKKITGLGKALNNIRQFIKIKDDIDILDIKKGVYTVHDFIYNFFLKCWYNPQFDIEYANLVNQDWYHPYYATHHTKEEISEWFLNNGFSEPQYIQPKGWDYSGYFVSARKK